MVASPDPERTEARIVVTFPSGCFVLVGDGEGLGLGLGVGLGVGFGDGVGSGRRVFVGVGVGFGDGRTVGDGDGDGVGLGVGVGGEDGSDRLGLGEDELVGLDVGGAAALVPVAVGDGAFALGELPFGSDGLEVVGAATGIGATPAASGMCGLFAHTAVVASAATAVIAAAATRTRRRA